MLCKKLEISRVQSRRDGIVFTFDNPNPNIDILKIIQDYKNRLSFTQGIKPQIMLKLIKMSEREIIKETKNFLKYLKKED